MSTRTKARTGTRTEIGRLAAARPAILSHTEQVIDAAGEDRLLDQILSSQRDPAPSRTPARVPAPAPGAPPRRRIPKVAVGAVAGTAAAAVAVTGALAGAGAFPGGAGHTHGGGQAVKLTAQTVTARAVAALGRVSGGISYSHAVVTAGGAAIAGARAGTVVDQWLYGHRVRQEEFTPGGRLVVDDSSAYWTGRDSHIFTSQREVDYTSRTWFANPPASTPLRGPIGSYAAELARSLKWEESHGLLRVCGAGTVRGHRAVKLCYVRPKGNQNQNGPSPVLEAPFDLGTLRPTEVSFYPGTSTVLWIDAASYLPVQTLSGAWPPLAGGGGKIALSTSIEWLTPDRANLAHLRTAPVPPGFRKVTSPAH